PCPSRWWLAQPCRYSLVVLLPGESLVIVKSGQLCLGRRGVREFNFYHRAGVFRKLEDPHLQVLLHRTDQHDGRLVRGGGADARGRLLSVLREFHEASAVASPVARQGERGVDARGGDLQRVAGAEVDLAAFLGGVEKRGDLLGDLLQQVEVGAD